ncbi:hypothetical protein TIFTF001_002121 [Ficus carica]|uniref:Uncharacterized protein n=1 Tax=Ficus carica TaxID=3494 RepID=A0AA88CRL3_FICCA|nr:hypothetical protein TIFTF001_002121 [Ficus carica]
MGEMRYKRVIGNGMMKMRWQRSSRGGIRLNLKRFLVSSLRPKMVRLLRVLSRWRVKALQALKLNTRKNNNNSVRTSSKARLVASDYNCDHHRGFSCDHHRMRLTSLGRTNSFYAEAIADCLEFIKRSSISVDHHPNSLLLHSPPYD